MLLPENCSDTLPNWLILDWLKDMVANNAHIRLSSAVLHPLLLTLLGCIV